MKQELRPAPPSTKVSLQLLITKAMEKSLLEKGYTQEQVNKMTPTEAHELLASIEKQIESAPKIENQVQPNEFDDRQRLQECEAVLERAQRNRCLWYEQGKALFNIRKHRLWRLKGYISMEDYTRKEWNFSRSHIDRFIQAYNWWTEKEETSPTGDTSQPGARPQSLNAATKKRKQEQQRPTPRPSENKLNLVMKLAKELWLILKNLSGEDVQEAYRKLDDILTWAKRFQPKV